MADEMQTVYMSDGCAIKVKILGDQPGKPLAIAHHGAPGYSTHAVSIVQFGFLADAFRLLVFDMRGSGWSDQKPPYAYSRWVQDVEELRRWTGAEKFLMVGGSHGGFLTLQYSVTYPHRMLGAIIGDAALYYSHATAMSALATAVTDPRVECDPYLLVRAFSGTMTAEDNLMDVARGIAPLYRMPADVRSDDMPNETDVLAQVSMPFWESSTAAQRCLLSFDMRGRIAGVRVKMFIYVGRYDWLYPVTLSQQLAEAVQDSTFTVYEKSGHIPALQERTKFQADVRAFIGKLDIPDFR